MQERVGVELDVAVAAEGDGVDTGVACTDEVEVEFDGAILRVPDVGSR